MNGIIKLYSDKPGEIFQFLNNFYQNNHSASEEEIFWQKTYENPVMMADMIGIFIENNDKYKINMWISLDKDLYINITEHNADEVIRYLYERFPY